MDEKKKRIAVIALVGIAAVLVYWVAFAQGIPYAPDGLPVTRSEFLEELGRASTVYIVMDLRQADGAVYQNILQCGVDFAGSPGLAGKEIVNMAFEGDVCISTLDASTVQACIQELDNGTTLYIHSSEQTAFYRHAVMVGIGEEYALDDCRVNRL